LLTAIISSDALDWIKKSLPKSSLKRLFLETRMSANAKNPPEGLKDSECKRGNIVNRPPILYVQPMDPNKKQGKTENKVKVKLPDRTNYQMVLFQAGTNEDYITHIITMKRLLEQKKIEDEVEKAFGVVTVIMDDKLGPLYKKLNMSKSKQEKEDLQKQLESDSEEVLKAPEATSSRPTS
jgi:hypothetical protein